jgi:hypothetical protein
MSTPDTCGKDDIVSLPMGRQIEGVLRFSLPDKAPVRVTVVCEFRGFELPPDRAVNAWFGTLVTDSAVVTKP